MLDCTFFTEVITSWCYAMVTGLLAHYGGLPSIGFAAYPIQDLFCLFTTVNHYIMANNVFVLQHTSYFITFLLFFAKEINFDLMILISCLIILWFLVTSGTCFSPFRILVCPKTFWSILLFTFVLTDSPIPFSCQQKLSHLSSHFFCQVINTERGEKKKKKAKKAQCKF